MYDFTNINDVPFNSELSIQTVLNGTNIDNALQGFRTLAVHGRDLIGRKISTQDYDNMGGSKTKGKGTGSTSNKYLGSALPSRILTVDFNLSAENNKDFRKTCERLNYYLHNEEMTIQFTDDLNYQYKGTLSNIENIDSFHNDIYSTFTLECADPFKYSIKNKSFTFNTHSKFNFWTFSPALFSKIIIDVKTNTNILKLTNITNGDVIILNDNFINNDKVIIDIDNNIITKNNNNIFNKLDLISDLEFFGAIFNDELITNVNSNVEILFRERRL